MTRALLLLCLLSGCDPDRDPSPSPAVDTSPRGHRDESTPAPSDPSPEVLGDESVILPTAVAELRQDECAPELLGERCPLCGPLECSPGVWTCEEGRMRCAPRPRRVSA